MVLKKEVVKINVNGEEKEITLTELSLLGQFELEEMGTDKTLSSIDLYRKSMSEEDFKLLGELGREESKLIRDAYGRLNAREVEAADHQKKK